MLIQVAYPGEKFDYVKEFMLDILIEEKKIAKFRRQSGWVTIGTDPVRINKNNIPYPYEERRSARTH